MLTDITTLIVALCNFANTPKEGYIDFVLKLARFHEDGWRNAGIS